MFITEELKIMDKQKRKTQNSIYPETAKVKHLLDILPNMDVIVIFSISLVHVTL